MGRKILKDRDNAAFFKTLKLLLIIGSVLAALKVIFVDYTLDEEYQIMMAYRRLTGDKLFGAMWEPHQTSSFGCYWLMWIYHAVTGSTTGVVLFLRICTTMVQIVLALWFYRVCSHYVRREYSFLLGLIYFNISPKIIQIPEFANLQVWFFTVIVLSLIQYYEIPPRGASGKASRWWLILAGTGMAFEVLAYPSSLLLFPVFLISIFLLSKRKKPVEWTDKRTGHVWADCAVFTGVCVVWAVLWLGYVFIFVPPETFLRNVKYMLDFDLTHDVSPTAEAKIISFANSIGPILMLFTIIFLAALVIWFLLYLIQKRRGESARFSVPVFAVLLVLAAEAVQCYYWIIFTAGYEAPLIHLPTLMLAAAFSWHMADGRKRALFTGLVGAVFTILIVIYTSDLGVTYAFSHGMVGSLLAILILIYALETEQGVRGQRWNWILLVSLAVVSIFGKGFILRAGGTVTNSVLGIRGIIREGPAAGIFTNYMQAYITNCTYDEFQKYVEQGANCLIVNNKVGAAGTTPYFFRDCNVCHFSVVDYMDSSSYNESLLTYWSLYPEKQPDVIVVDCWFGQLLESEDSWIMQYIENDFHYSNVIDGQYVRYYFK